MKRLLLSLVVIATAGALNAQIYSATDSSDFAQWIATDLDGDTHGWDVIVLTDFAGSTSITPDPGGCAKSHSWTSTAGALTPDNVLMSPVIDLAGVTSVTVSWGAASNQDPSNGFYSENYAVYILDAADLAAIAGGGAYPTPDWEGILTTGSVMEYQNADASAFAGQSDVYVLVRHYNCTDQNYMILDDVMVTGSSAGIEESSIVSSVYPNPAMDILNVTSSVEATSVSIISLDGKIVSTTDVNGTTTLIDVSTLNSGVYFYEVATSSGTNVRNTFVKK